MKPPAFDYVPVDTVEAALAALAAAAGDAKIIAGGQSLVPMLNFRLLKPSVLVDINRIPGLAFIEDDGDAVRIGALTRHRQIEIAPLIAENFPVMAAAMTHVAHLAVRNRGTIGGSLSHADPAAELPMLARLLDAELTIVSPTGERGVSAHDFFQGQLSVDLGDAELLSEIRIPKLPPSTGWGFAEVARRTGDFALAAVAVTLTVTDDSIVGARVAMTGVGETPRRAEEVENLLLGRRLEPALVDAACEAARTSVEPESDLHASADYRRHLVDVLTRRTLTEAWARARGGAA
jgi:CO/xanthine dehydrogenase FAD-binding subunit